MYLLQNVEMGAIGALLGKKSGELKGSRLAMLSEPFIRYLFICVPPIGRSQHGASISFLEW
jgi:hypothetical protein